MFCSTGLSAAVWHGLDLVVGSLRWFGGDRTAEGCEDSGPAGLETFGKILGYSDAGCFGPADAVVKVSLGSAFVRWLPGEAEILVDARGHSPKVCSGSKPLGVGLGHRTRARDSWSSSLRAGDFP